MSEVTYQLRTAGDPLAPAAAVRDIVRRAQPRVSYGIARRTGEIGVRMALAARRATVVWMVLRDVITLAALGLAVSVPAALAASTFLESFLFDMTRYDPLALTAAKVTLVGATLLAGYVPARNASRINPMAALRHE